MGTSLARSPCESTAHLADWETPCSACLIAEREFGATLARMMKRIASAALAVLALVARAEIKTEVIEYREDTTTLEGFVPTTRP